MGLRKRGYFTENIDELSEALTIPGLRDTADRVLVKAKNLARHYSKSPRAMSDLKRTLQEYASQIAALASSLKTEKETGARRFMPRAFKG